jgi:YggT family protein
VTLGALNSVGGAIAAIGTFYGWLIIIYVLMTWFPLSGFALEIHSVLASIVEPYLSLFRRFIPPLGGIDLSPLVAYFVLQLVLVPVLVSLASLLVR